MSIAQSRTSMSHRKYHSSLSLQSATVSTIIKVINWRCGVCGCINIKTMNFDSRNQASIHRTENLRIERIVFRCFLCNNVMSRSCHMQQVERIFSGFSTQEYFSNYLAEMNNISAAFAPKNIRQIFRMKNQWNERNGTKCDGLVLLQAMQQSRMIERHWFVSM